MFYCCWHVTLPFFVFRHLFFIIIFFHCFVILCFFISLLLRLFSKFKILKPFYTFFFSFFSVNLISFIINIMYHQIFFILIMSYLFFPMRCIKIIYIYFSCLHTTKGFYTCSVCGPNSDIDLLFEVKCLLFFLYQRWQMRWNPLQKRSDVYILTFYLKFEKKKKKNKSTSYRLWEKGWPGKRNLVIVTIIRKGKLE